MAKINNVAYSWSMIQIEFSLESGLDSAILAGVSSIKWNIKRNVKTNYGLGGEPINRGFGNKEYTASITLDYNAQSQLRAIVQASGGSSLMDLGEFNIIVSWTNDMGAGVLVDETVTLEGCMFTEEGLEVNQDDTNITKEFDLNPFKITPQAIGI